MCSETARTRGKKKDQNIAQPGIKKKSTHRSTIKKWRVSMGGAEATTRVGGGHSLKEGGRRTWKKRKEKIVSAGTVFPVR